MYRFKQLRNYKKKKTMWILRGPQLGKQRWRARLGTSISRVKQTPAVLWTVAHPELRL